jgi:3-oxoadipate enol-lactonase
VSTNADRGGQIVHVNSGTVAGDGGGVYYETAWTDHSAPAIVLTHDGLLHRETWDAQLTTFAHRYRVARWDRRGYGRSPAPHAPYSSIDDLARVVRAVSAAPATLIGCSFGSLLSLHCTLDNAQLVGALVLVGPIVSGLGYSEHFLTRGGHRPPAPDAPVAEQLHYWTTTDPWIVAAGNDSARQRLRALLAANPNNLRQRVDLEQRPASAALERLGQISVPTLLVVGEADIPDVHAHSGAIEAGIPGARRVVLSGSGHLPQLEVPDAFNRIVLEFLDSHTNRG